MLTCAVFNNFGAIACLLVDRELLFRIEGFLEVEFCFSSKLKKIKENFSDTIKTKKIAEYFKLKNCTISYHLFTYSLTLSGTIRFFWPKSSLSSSMLEI